MAKKNATDLLFEIYSTAVKALRGRALSFMVLITGLLSVGVSVNWPASFTSRHPVLVPSLDYFFPFGLLGLAIGIALLPKGYYIRADLRALERLRKDNLITEHQYEHRRQVYTGTFHRKCVETYLDWLERVDIRGITQDALQKLRNTLETFPE